MMNNFIKKLLAIILCILLSSCFTYRDLAGLGPLPEPLNWKKNQESEKYSYNAFNECKSDIDASIYKEERGRVIADCMYAKGYRFKPEFGWCSRAHLKNTYICQNREKYSN